MFTFTYKSTQIVVPEKHYRTLVETWFDDLEESEVKRSVRRIKWKEMKPEKEHFSLRILCEHPFSEEVAKLVTARQGDDSEVILAAVEQILGKFGHWITPFTMPQAAIMNGREVDISWMPLEVPYYDPDDIPPQEKAMHEVNRQASRSLWMIHVATQPIEDFVKEKVGTNIPFVAAGNISTGARHLTRHFPENFPETEAEKESFAEWVTEHSADYVVLCRLAEHFGCDLPLIVRTREVIDEFIKTYFSHLTDWGRQYAITEEEDYDYIDSDPLVSADEYSVLEEAADHFRQALIEATQGREEEIAQMINSFLADLPIPDSPWKGDLEDGADWWKRG